MKILVEKAVIEQALEALGGYDSDFNTKHYDLITALREALGKPELWYCNKCGKNHCQCPPWIESNYKPVEQAEQEPVAWMHKQYGHIQVNHAEIPDEAKRKYSTNGQWTPLYATPVRTKDLTDDEIDKLIEHAWNYPLPLPEFARAVIAADRNKNR